MEKARLLNLCVLILLVSTVAWADHPTIGFGTGLAGPITTISATPAPKGAWSAGFRMEYVDFDAFSGEELLTFAEKGERVESTDRLASPFLGIAYGLTNNLTLSLRVSYVFRGNIREPEFEEGGFEVHHHGNSAGIGDLAFIGQYRFFDAPGGKLEAAALFGMKFPTGKTEVRDSQGELFEADHQPGSGSWDPILGLAVAKRFDGLSLDGNALYTVATQGTQNTDLGDLLNFNMAVSHRVTGEHDHHDYHGEDETQPHSHHSVAWDLILEMNGESRESRTIRGAAEENSGGTLVYLTPGVRAIGRHGSVFLSVGIPVFQKLHGDQHKTSLRVLLGFGTNF